MADFERYDEEFASLTEQVTSKIKLLDPATTNGVSPPTADADIKMAHNLLLQADDLLKQMGLEARGADDASVKRDLLGKVRICFDVFVKLGRGCVLFLCQFTVERWVQYETSASIILDHMAQSNALFNSLTVVLQFDQLQGKGMQNTSRQSQRRLRSCENPSRAICARSLQ